MDGLNFSYLDSKLIKLLSSSKNQSIKSNTNQDTTKEDLDFYLNNISQYFQELDEILEEHEIMESRVKDLNQDIMKRTKKQKDTIKKCMRRALLLTTYVGSIILSIYGARAATTSKKYLTTTEKYNITTSKNLPLINSYESKLNDSISLIYYHPWKDASSLDQLEGKYNFARTLTTYDVSDIVYDNLEQYATLSPVELGIPSQETTELKDCLFSEDLYKDTFKIVQKITQDKSNFIKELDSFLYKSLLFPVIIFIVVIEICVIPFYKKELIYGLLKSSLKKIKQSLELQKEIKIDSNLLDKYLAQIEEISSQIEQLIIQLNEEYTKLPKQLKDDPELKEVMKDTKKILKKVKKTKKINIIYKVYSFFY